ncbi:MAG: tetratricopeptide repeat protein [Deltaproteobacteria bacterium]|nr:tetratricopeptide repeat protein [Deltaproteobacteria bacterium]
MTTLCGRFRGRTWLWFIGGWMLVLGCGDRSAEPTAEKVETPPPIDEQTQAVLHQLELLRQQGRYGEGIELARRELESNPQRPRLHYGLAVLLGSADDHLAAVEEFAAELKLDPDHFGSHQGIATALSRLGRLEESLPHLRRCIEIDPSNGDASYQLGRNLSALGSYGEAEPYLLDAVTFQGDAQGYNELGVLYRRQGDLPRAQEAFRSALGQDRRYLAAILGLGQVLIRLGHAETGKALLAHHEQEATLADRQEHLERSSRLAGARAGNFLQLAEHYLLVGLDEKAAAAYRGAFELNPEEPAIGLGLASIFLRRGDLEKASQWAVHALARAPEEPETHLMLALTRVRKGQMEAAERAFAEVRRLGGWDSEAALSRAEALLDFGDSSGAVLGFEEALHLEDENPEASRPLARLGLAKSLLASGKAASAERAVRVLGGADLPASDSALLLGLALWQREDWEEARAAFTLAANSLRAELAVPGSLPLLEAPYLTLPGAAPALAAFRQIAVDTAALEIR